MLSPMVGQNIYDVRQSIADVWESDKSWEWIQAVEIPETEKELKKSIERLSQGHLGGSVIKHPPSAQGVIPES